jgi:protocatechuate 3,4-dioxygenase alpha subunit
VTSRLSPTAGQTVGPFFHYALPFDGSSEVCPPDRSDAIRLHGTVFDGAGDPVPDALLEIWQADPDGVVVQLPGSLHRDGITFTGWGRAATDAAGHYSFRTVTPGATDAGRAPFFAVTVFARGLLDRLFTRAYLPGHADLGREPLLAALSPERRRTLVASTDPDGGLIFDVHLQGPLETVFLSFSGR